MKESKQPENLNQNNNNSITSNGNNNVANQTNINQLNYNTQVYHYWNNSARPAEPPFIEFWKEVRNVLIKALISSLLTLPWSGEMKNIFPMLKTVNPVWITVVLWLMLYGISSLYIMIYRYRGQRIVSAVFFLAAIFIGLVILENLLKNYAIILDMIVIICVSSLIIVDIVRMIKKGITANKCRIKKVKDGKKTGNRNHTHNK